jgi:dihydrofolate reductase
MQKVILGMTMSVDGFIADRSGDLSLLYPDMDALRASPMLKETIRTTGAVVMGRGAYDIAQGDLTGYEFQTPIFVLTHHPPDQRPEGENDDLKVIFIEDKIESVIEQAKTAAGGRNVTIIGGADVARQALESGRVDELEVGIAPLLLGEGRRWFDQTRLAEKGLENIGITDVAGVTFLRFRMPGKGNQGNKGRTEIKKTDANHKS